MNRLNKFKVIFTDRMMLIVLLFGFSSGLPYYLTQSTLQAWVTRAGWELSAIGYLTGFLVFPYTLKFFWSPFLDWLIPPFLGRRRGWLMMAQIGLVLSLLILANGDPNPKGNTAIFAFMALITTVFAATQDIGIDAYNVEILPREAFGLGNQIYIVGFRLAPLIAVSMALVMSDHMSWRAVYSIMAAVMGISVLTTLVAKEPVVSAAPPRRFVDAVWLPFKDFFSPRGSHRGKALWILAFVLLYNLGANMTIALSTTFYIKLGFTNTQIGYVAKGFGFGATIVGGIIGGLGVIFLGNRKSLWTFGIVQGIAPLVFAWLYHMVNPKDPSIVILAVAVVVENVAIALGTAAYATYLGSIVNRSFTATQYALLTSFMNVTRSIAAFAAGHLTQSLGWGLFYYICAAASVPGLLLLLKIDTPSTSAPMETEAQGLPA